MLLSNIVKNSPEHRSEKLHNDLLDEEQRTDIKK